MNIAKFIKDNLSYLILGMMILGLANGYVNDVSGLKVLVTPTLFLMVYPMMINLKVTDLFEGISNPKPLLISLGMNFIISPIIAFGLSKLFFANQPMLTVGLILISLIPTSGMTASWTGLANGNMKSALLIISSNLLLSIVMIPLYMKLFIGEAVTVDTMTIIYSLLKVVIIPLVLGDITRRILMWKYKESGFKKIKPHLGAISSVGVLIIVFVAMSLKSKTIINESSLVLYSLVPLVIYYGVLLIISHSIGSRVLDRGNSIALVYGSTMRNLTISLGLSLSAFGGGLSVFLIAIGYIIQVPLAAFYMRMLMRGEVAIN
ncbi:arsenic resistance protein [Caldisalinibacter kiritimatiensis]|uniref:Arsenical-resistance protein ACR3 n=1 Tax=Caldisalinibacter kiritimatiensis TaxID=1304284 RepID=R1CUG3_9FIRM|nr:bile acid:sodium symporter [Caldisalinibacter kiritimatiensis]EOD00314.1 Arsenical-resistance protein ACR3 [Caldisalinibacter kiritimatiensis]